MQKQTENLILCFHHANDMLCLTEIKRYKQQLAKEHTGIVSSAE